MSGDQLFRGWRAALVFAILPVWVASSGCAFRVDWPDGPPPETPNSGRLQVRGYRIGGGKQVDYRQTLTDGRVVSLEFADSEDAEAETVDWGLPDPAWPHFVIILDGAPYGLVRQMYQEGRFRLFRPPTRMVSTFPAMTDLALSRVLGSRPCMAVEAQYFDRDRNALSDANAAYLSGENAPWLSRVDYAAPQNAAIKAYLDPAGLFNEELRGMYRLFSSRREGTVIAYSLGTAGMGTCGGERAMRAYLSDIDKLCERIVYDHRGRVRISVLADHGQTRQPCKMVDFKEALTAAGFRVGKSLNAPGDVVRIRYGIVTCACLYTRQPAAVAETLLAQPSVDLATWPEGDAVIVRRGAERAVLRQQAGGFTYDDSQGDPLDLRGILELLRNQGHVRGDGVIEDRPLFVATADHSYPDPLHRIWACFHGLVQQPPDLVVSLKPAYCHGSDFFHFFVNPVASTHGDLGRASSETFVLSTAWTGTPPDVIRVEDAAAAIGLPAER